MDDNTKLAEISVTADVESSDDEYFDAEDDNQDHLSVAMKPNSTLSPSISVSAFEGDPPEVQEDKDFQESNDIETIMSSNRSMILHLLSQVRIGMDLTRFILPVFIFEKRSLLELYAEFFSHPDIILNSADLQNPRDRMVQVVKWFLSSLSASRKADFPQKPYNPVLGERFCCYWDTPNGKRTPPNAIERQLLESGPDTCGGYDSLSYIAEQVSHHPPISALYLECPSKRIYFSGSVETKLKFQFGLSVKVHNHGKFKLHFLNHDEVYVGTFPHGYVRSVLTKPWLEFGGDCTISCEKSGYSTTIDFHTKPFRGGQKHRITGALRHTSEGKPLMKLEGNWNSIVYKKISKDTREVFFDAQSTPSVRKKVKKFALQEEYDSRIVWKNVTEALEREDAEAAAAAKHEVEEAQRQKVRDRRATGEEWEPKYFKPEVDGKETVWVFKTPLNVRMRNLV